jgi:Clostripain family
MLSAVYCYNSGGGFAGFGGDENAPEVRHRKLLQTNQAIATAVRAALDSNPGGPTKLEVLGFDACLMQSLGAADDYQPVADYILASEAVEPGHGEWHTVLYFTERRSVGDYGKLCLIIVANTNNNNTGWSYKLLETAASALELSRQVVDTFLTDTQGGKSHQSPKTLAIVDTAKFQTFVETLESLASVLLGLLEGGDRSLHAFVSRSRGSSIAFEGVADSLGTNKPSALDIGSWLENFQVLCDPDPAGALGAAVLAATTSYTDMMVEEGVGEGTAQGTGMHLDWPIQSEYQANKALWEQILFQNPSYATSIAPNFQAFLEWFLLSSVPDGVSRDSVCRQNAEAESNIQLPEEQTSLFLVASGTVDAPAGMFHIFANISLDASEISVQYGINLTTPLKEELVKREFEPDPKEYLFLLGGDVVGRYEQNTFAASWDTNFYFLNITGSNAFEALYVKDQGDGSKTVPVMFFPDDKREDISKLQFLDYLFFDFDFWIENGAQYGFLKFSVDEAIGRVNDNLALFVSNAAGVFTEYPRSGRGLLLPLIQVDAYVQGRNLTSLPGGFNQTVIEWSENLAYNILTTPIRNIFKQVETADAVVVTMTAFKYGDEQSLPEAKTYSITAAEAGTITSNVATDPPTPPTPPTNATNPPGSPITNATAPTESPKPAGPQSNASNIFDNGGTEELVTDDGDQTQTNATGNVSNKPISQPTPAPVADGDGTGEASPTVNPDGAAQATGTPQPQTNAPTSAAPYGKLLRRQMMLSFLLVVMCALL